MIAVIIVDVKHQAVDRGFDYHVPAFLMADIEVGHRVEVPFGSRVISGVVIELKEASSLSELKSITAILDLKPVYGVEHLELAQALSKRYLTPMSAYLAVMLPPALRMTYQKYVRLIDQTRLPESLRPAFGKQSFRKATDVSVLDASAFRDALSEGVLEPYTDVRQKQHPRHEPYLVLLAPKPVRGPKQKRVLAALIDGALHQQTALLKQTEASTATLKSLLDQGIIEVVSKEVRDERKTLMALQDKVIVLTEAQKQVVKQIADALKTPQTFLLHGVTSSGKTEVYIALTEQVLSQGESVLILVPEISLTPALTARFKARFGQKVAVYHSRLTAREQYDAWRRIKQGTAHVMIGARSAIFAPFKQLGLIIMDEAHSDSYRQEEIPAYDALYLARTRSMTHAVPLVLGTATPTLDMTYQTIHGDDQRLELKQRVLDSVQPAIDIVDMRQEFLAGNTSIFSAALAKAMQDRFTKGEQTLLLINRRGHARFVLCRRCGKTIDCDGCDLPKTYHQHSHTLKCHYCQTSMPMPLTCPKCGSEHIRFMGLGSERVENEVRKFLPAANVSRMDRDTTGKKDAHERILHAFEVEGDVLVGTQMIAKGLDFPKVTLVGVLSADMSLYVPDPYAREETFALLTQVAGRSGRRGKQGTVIIQAYDAAHPILEDVKNNDYARFYERESQLRAHTGMPPFAQVLTVRLSHKQANAVHLKAIELRRHLKQTMPEIKVVGPVRPTRARSHGYDHTVLLMRHQDESTLLEQLHTFFTRVDRQAFQWRIDHRPNLM